MTEPVPFELTPGGNDRRVAPHVARNAEAIIDVLRTVLPAGGVVLEVGSGSGEHAVRFARAFPALKWQPSDPDPVALRSIEAWRQVEGAPNLLPALPLDAAAGNWPLPRADAIICMNMVHINPWDATEGLMLREGRVMEPG